MRNPESTPEIPAGKTVATVLGLGGKMNKWIAYAAAFSIGFAGPFAVRAQTFEPAAEDSVNDSPALRKVFSDRPFFGTQQVLTLSGNYVNSPREDYLETGSWNLPLSLDQMSGMIGEISFGEAAKQGQWQLSYRYKVMTMDSEWQAIADSSSGLSLSDRRSQVLKASYNVRDWWKVGLAAVVEDRSGVDPTIDPGTFGLNNHEGVGFQIDTLLKF
jgi:hypothetical protein